MYQRGRRESAAARKGFTPMFCGGRGGRESAATWKGICKARCGTPPSPAATPPLAGEAFGAAAAQKGSPARGAGCAGRRRLRGALPVCSGNTPQGPAASCPAAHGGSARPRGGRDRPPYIAAENGQRSVNGRRFKARRRADASIGPYAGGGWRPGGCGGPEGPCPRVSQGGMRRPGECGSPAGYCLGKVRHPFAACGDTSPCRGGFWDGGPQKGSSARGAGCAGRRRPRGALPLCGGNTPQGLAGPCPRVSQGVCGGRESAAARKGIGKARCGTPPSPAATPPLTGEASGGGNAQKGSPARGAFQAAVCSKPPPR